MPDIDVAAVVPCRVYEGRDVFVDVVGGDHGLLGFIRVWVEPGEDRRGRLLADRAVDPFPQQVGVAVVAGVLLHHVGQHPAQ